MKKETQRIMKSFLRGEKRTEARTSTDGVSVYLKGNKIIERVSSMEYELTLAGWSNATTRDRLNGFLEMLGSTKRFYVKDYINYFGEWEVKPTSTIRLVLN